MRINTRNTGQVRVSLVTPASLPPQGSACDAFTVVDLLYLFALGRQAHTLAEQAGWEIGRRKDRLEIILLCLPMQFKDFGKLVFISSCVCATVRACCFDAFCFCTALQCFLSDVVLVMR